MLRFIKNVLLKYLSLKSIKIYFIINGVLCLLSVIQNIILTSNLLNVFISFLIGILFRNYVLLGFMSKNKKTVIKEDHKNYNLWKYHKHVIIGSFIESCTLLVSLQLITFRKMDLLYDMITFIPLSFIFEIILDFFHYWFHRLLHHNYFYFIHKQHHSEINPRPIVNFYQHPLETIIAIEIPSLITLSIIPNISFFVCILLFTYKMYIELAGHAGVISKPSCSFPQCVIIPKTLSIELYTEDHHLHHSINKYNYSKRFKFWDKVFGTYRHPTYDSISIHQSN